MYLSPLRINWRHRLAQRDLNDRYELHRTVRSAFPKQQRSRERVLYRLEPEEGRPYSTILVQSQTLPNWAESRRFNIRRYLFQLPAMRCIQPQFQKGTRLPFRLQANPTVTTCGKRHALKVDGEIAGWLQRTGEQHGFAVDPLHVRTVVLGEVTGNRRQQKWFVVQFDGILEVVTAEKFTSALHSGVGSAKAFGCGLLSVPYPTA